MDQKARKTPVVIDARNWTGDVERDYRLDQERREARQLAFEKRLVRWPFAYGLAFATAGLGMMVLPWLPYGSAADLWTAFDAVLASAVGLVSCAAGGLQIRRGIRAKRTERS